VDKYVKESSLEDCLLISIGLDAPIGVDETAVAVGRDADTNLEKEMEEEAATL
jgi:hypothetical protein